MPDDHRSGSRQGTTYQEDEDHRAYERAEMTKANKKVSRMHSWRSFAATGFPVCVFLRRPFCSCRRSSLAYVSSFRHWQSAVDEDCARS
jgi:hypothetical protein